MKKKPNKRLIKKVMKLFPSEDFTWEDYAKFVCPDETLRPLKAKSLELAGMLYNQALEVCRIANLVCELYIPEKDKQLHMDYYRNDFVKLPSSIPPV
ncbi:hypothetical protein EIM50_17725, partial [Pseudoxanthomonas sp. SGD-10]